MSKYGYCRISRPTQNIERQARNIKESFSDAIIIQEVYTGTQTNRPEWLKLFEKVSKDDIIIFDSVSRMSRNADEGFSLYQELFNRGVDLVFLKEPHINTETYKEKLQHQINIRIGKNGIDEATNKCITSIIEVLNSYTLDLAKQHIKLAFEQAEKEVADLHQRTKEGIETARLNGKQIGQKKGNKLNVKKEQPIKNIIIEKCKDFKGQNSDAEVMAIIKNTTYTDERTKAIKTYNISRNTYYKYKRDIKETI